MNKPHHLHGTMLHQWHGWHDLFAYLNRDVLGVLVNPLMQLFVYWPKYRIWHQLIDEYDYDESVKNMGVLVCQALNIEHVELFFSYTLRFGQRSVNLSAWVLCEIELMKCLKIWAVRSKAKLKSEEKKIKKKAADRKGNSPSPGTVEFPHCFS